VSVRARNKRQQVIAFNVTLVREILVETRYVAVGIDPEKDETAFIPCGEFYKGQPAHKLAVEGGNPTGKVIYLNPAVQVYFDRVRVGRYPAKFVNGKIVISTPGVGLRNPVCKQ
jgi:hypothetical protein